MPLIQMPRLSTSNDTIFTKIDDKQDDFGFVMFVFRLCVRPVVRSDRHFEPSTLFCHNVVNICVFLFQ